MNGSFRISVWDPSLIISQIVAVQCIMYVTLGLWIILLLHVIAGHPISIDYIFKYQVNVKDVSGRLVIACFLLNSLICATALWAIVQRTKLCLDFSVTAHFLHFVASLLYNAAWPSSASWWVLNLSCVTITCVLGEFLCMRTEMKSIPLGMSARVDL
uniref:Protein SYS1 homolog n=1 Tax=Moina brachiata TaxID=675436 RepID=A0A4Y7NJH2_9CRUS|nr:EOG090X0FH3 [Moina brachiata]SVE93312.1 EOG090X0FH3 [Moina brachiata]